MVNLVLLKKDGLFGETWSEKLDDYVVEGHRAGGNKKGEFFVRNCDVRLVVDDDVTFRDLVKFLVKLNADEMHELCRLSNSNVHMYVEEFAKDPAPQEDEDDFGKLHTIEVYKVIELNNFSTADDVFDIQISTSAHGLGEIWKDVLEKKTKVKKELLDRCNTYAIEFTPWQQLLDLKISIKKYIDYAEVIWEKTRPREMKFGIYGTKRKVSLGKSDRRLKKSSKFSTTNKKIRNELSMKEFFTGLFNELCFFSSPERRKQQSDVLKSRIDSVEKDLKKKK